MYVLISVLVVALVLICIFIPKETEIKETEWRGQVVVFAYHETMYDKFFHTVTFPEIRRTFDMSVETFGEKANVTVHSYTEGDSIMGDVFEKTVNEKGIQFRARDFLVFILDENGNILLAETDEDKIIQCLKDNGFNGSTK
ncbi:MAG: hypothetical protein E7623_01260 [Ruminococcaceae bacterium]|nr:hypothetical protein [Oscillospiraceae bacterium]